jgi:hypothetical protein
VTSLSLLAATALWAAPAAGAGATAAPDPVEFPLPWQDPSAIGRLFLQLPFQDPEVTPRGRVRVGARLQYSNHLLVESSPTMSAEIDFESLAATPSVQVGLGDGVELQAALPFQADFGGVLDGVIDAVERGVHATPGPRRGRPPGMTRFRLRREDGTGVEYVEPTVGLGDAWGGVKVALATGRPGPALSLRGALKLPTGRPGFGSGTVDLGVGAQIAWDGHPVTFHLEVDAVAPTGDLQGAGLPTRLYGAAQGGLSVRLGRDVALHLQMSAHLSPVYTDLDVLSKWTFYVVAGVSVRLGAAGLLRIGIAENVVTPYRGADFAVLADGGLQL